MSDDGTQIGGGLGIRDVVMDHQRRLNGIEERERQVSERLGDIRRSLWPLKPIAWVFTTAGAVTIGVLVVALIKIISYRVADAPPSPFPGERLGSERVPQPQQQGANGR